MNVHTNLNSNHPFFSNFSNWVIGHDKLFKDMLTVVDNVAYPSANSYPPHNLTKHEDGLKQLGIFDVLRNTENQAHLVKKLKQSVENKYKNFKGKSMVSKVLGTTEVSDALASSLFQSSTRQNDLRRIYNLTQKKS